MTELDEHKTKYFVIAIIILIILSIFLIFHFNNKSLVDGADLETPTTTITTTTSKITTTKKVEMPKINAVKVNKEEKEVKDEIVEEVIYKSTIDEINKLIYNYKLTNEILDTDKLISTKIEITDLLKEKNIVSLFDISLYDSNMNKKNVKKSVIDISIPITDELKGYDEYKIVYINELNEITEEKFETNIVDGYIKFETSHLSLYGVIGFKKENEIIPEPEKTMIDLTDVTLDIKINDTTLNDFRNVYVSVEDKLNITVKNLSSEYKLYYLLKKDELTTEYKEYKNDLFSEINTPSKYTLFIKVEVDNNNKIFEVGTFNIYDIVFVYDKQEVLEKDEVIGTIIDEEGNESSYMYKETNKNIVIDTVEKEEIIDETNTNFEDNIDENSKEVVTNTEENNLNSSIGEQDTIENQENELDTELEKTETEEEKTASIKLNGNIYLVEETDISNLEMTGHLIIDTNENITFKYENDKLLTSSLYTITIKSKEFSLNGNKYTYEYVDGNLVIKKVLDNIDITNDFVNIFANENYKTSYNEESLIIEELK